MEPTLVYNIQAGPYWNWKVALDLFLGGAGVGALVFAVALEVVFKGRYRRICQTAAWLSPVLVVLGLAFLLLKLGQPQKLVLVFTHFVPTSPTSCRLHPSGGVASFRPCLCSEASGMP